MKITKVEVFRLPTANSKQKQPDRLPIHTDQEFMEMERLEWLMELEELQHME